MEAIAITFDNGEKGAMGVPLSLFVMVLLTFQGPLLSGYAVSLRLLLPFRSPANSLFSNTEEELEYETSGCLQPLLSATEATFEHDVVLTFDVHPW